VTSTASESQRVPTTNSAVCAASGNVARVATLTEIVFDCERAYPLAQFWAAVLDGYDIRPYDDAEVSRLAALGFTPETDPSVMVDGPGPSVCFQEVSEPKQVKNRVHLDVRCDDRVAEVRRLTRLGASLAADLDDHSVMLDPEGNEFCITERR
jgi:hypothetical protein